MHASFGELAAKQGRPQDALARFGRCLAARRRFYPDDHPHIAHVTHSIGNVQSALGMTDEARLSQKAAANSLRRSQVHCAGPGCTHQQRPDGAPWTSALAAIARTTAAWPARPQTGSGRGATRRSARRWPRKGGRRPMLTVDFTQLELWWSVNSNF